MSAVSFAERRKAENASLSHLVDRVVESLVSAGEAKARFLLVANQVPSTVGTRVLFHPDYRRKTPPRD